MIVRPDFSASMSPASCSTAKWADMVGFDTAKRSDSSPADIGRSRSNCSTRRRVGSDSALNTLFTIRYLAKYRNIVKRNFDPADQDQFLSVTCRITRSQFKPRIFLIRWSV